LTQISRRTIDKGNRDIYPLVVAQPLVYRTIYNVRRQVDDVHFHIELMIHSSVYLQAEQREPDETTR